MLIQLQSQNLTIFELELELLSIEYRIVFVDNTMVVGADNNDIRGIVVLRACKVVYMVGFNNAIAIFVANSLATNLIAIIVELLKCEDDTAIYLAIFH